MGFLDFSLLMTPTMTAAIEEMKRLILNGFPEATFEVEHGEEPPGIYLIATVDLEDLGLVSDLYRDRLVDLQVEEGLRLYVIPSRPIARSLEMMRRERERMPWLRQA
jgi:hypothetical protein